MSQAQFIVSVALVLVMVGLSLMIGGLGSFWERKISAWIQDRIGPNRVGPRGLLQFMADGVKFFFKEDIIPANVDKVVFVSAPLMVLIPAMITFAVVPLGRPFIWAGEQLMFQIANLNIGVLYILAMASVGIYGIVFGAWASNNKYSLMGGLRASAQMISYELSLGLSLVAIVLVAGSLSLSDIIAGQTGYWFGVLPKWNVFCQPLAAITFIIAMFAETNRLPFDLPEAEQELVGGYHTEYSSLKFAIFFLAEYINMFLQSALAVILFFGGWQFPGLELLPKTLWVSLLSFGVFFLKALAFMFLYNWVRWTLPRFKYDQLMRIGWKRLLPATLANVFITAVWLAVTA